MSDEKPRPRRSLADVPQSAIGDGPPPKLTWAYQEQEREHDTMHTWDCDAVCGWIRFAVSIWAATPFSPTEPWSFRIWVTGVPIKVNSERPACPTLRDAQRAVERELVSQCVELQLQMLGYVRAPEVHS